MYWAVNPPYIMKDLNTHCFASCCALSDSHRTQSKHPAKSQSHLSKLQTTTSSSPLYFYEDHGHCVDAAAVLTSELLPITIEDIWGAALGWLHTLKKRPDAITFIIRIWRRPSPNALLPRAAAQLFWAHCSWLNQEGVYKPVQLQLLQLLARSCSVSLT